MTLPYGFMNRWRHLANPDKLSAGRESARIMAWRWKANRDVRRRKYANYLNRKRKSAISMRVVNPYPKKRRRVSVLRRGTVNHPPLKLSQARNSSIGSSSIVRDTGTATNLRTDNSTPVNIYTLGSIPGGNTEAKNIYGKECQTSTYINGIKFSFMTQSLIKHSPVTVRVLLVRNLYRMTEVGLPDDMRMCKFDGIDGALPTEKQDFFKNPNGINAQPVDFDSGDFKRPQKLYVQPNPRKYQVLYDKRVTLNPTGFNSATADNATTSVSSTNCVRHWSYFLPLKKELIYRYNNTTPSNDYIVGLAFAALPTDVSDEVSGQNIAHVKCVAYEYVTAPKGYDITT